MEVEFPGFRRLVQIDYNLAMDEAFAEWLASHLAGGIGVEQILAFKDESTGEEGLHIAWNGVAFRLAIRRFKPREQVLLAYLPELGPIGMPPDGEAPVSPEPDQP